MKNLTDSDLNSYKNIPVSPLIDCRSCKLRDIKDIKQPIKEVDLIDLYENSLILMNVILV